MPTKKTTRVKPTAKSVSKKATSKNTAAARKSPTKKSAAKKTIASRISVTSAKRGDLIVLDSAQVGSPPREGEVLEVIQGDIRLSYRVRWPDGRQTLITPTGGTARFVRASSRG
jgi:hypothetical protein